MDLMRFASKPLTGVQQCAPTIGRFTHIMNSSGSVGNLWWCRQNAIPDLIIYCKTKLLLPLHAVLCQCWQEGAVPQDMRDSKVIIIHKTRARGTTVTTTGASPYAALSAKYCSGHTDTPPEAGGAYLPIVTIWLPC